MGREVPSHSLKCGESSRIELVILSTEFPPGPGGLGAHAFQLADQLSAFGWSIHVLAVQDYATEQEICRFSEMTPYRLTRLPRARIRVLRLVLTLYRLFHCVKYEKPAIWVATGQRAVWISAILSPFLSGKWVAIAHGSEFGEPHSISSWLTRKAFERADAVVCVSHFTLNSMKRLGIVARQVAVIPNGADVDSFCILRSSIVREFRETQIPQAEVVLLTVGQLSRRKGQEVVIRALPEILREYPKAHYVMVGEPTLRFELETLARDLGVSNSVHFVGRVSKEEVVKWMNACDLFVMTSLTLPDGDREGYGIAAVEAALCGKAAVVSKETGLEEAVVNGETGISVPQGNPAATASAILALVRDNDLRQAMGQAAMKRATSEQTWDRRAAIYHQLFLRLLREEKPIL